MSTPARFASAGAPFASATTTAAAAAATSSTAPPATTTASAASATATAIAMLTPIVRRFVLFAPLPVLQGIPIGVVLTRPARLAWFARLWFRRFVLRSLFASVWGLGGLVAIAEVVDRAFIDGLGFARAAERCFQIEVGTKIVVGRSCRLAFLSRRTRRAARRAAFFTA